MIVIFNQMLELPLMGKYNNILTVNKLNQITKKIALEITALDALLVQEVHAVDLYFNLLLDFDLFPIFSLNIDKYHNF